MNLHHQHTHTWIKVSCHLLTIAGSGSSGFHRSQIYKVAPTALQFQQKSYLTATKKSTDNFFSASFCKLFILLLVFNWPDIVSGVLENNTVKIWCPWSVMNTGWQQGVNHGKDNALLEHAWFDSCRRMTLLDYYRFSSAALNCSFCSVSGALRGFSQWIPIDFSGHVIKLCVAWIVTTVFSSAPWGSSPLLTFYPIWLGQNYTKDKQSEHRAETGKWK